MRRLFHRLDRWLVRRIWSHRFKRWRNMGWKHLPERRLYGEYGLVLLVRHIEPLRQAVKCTRAERPFHIDAWVVLPDHMHCVITLLPGDDDFSNRIKAITIHFIQALAPTEGRSSVRMAKGERDVWQRRFREHAIRDEGDYARHIDYVDFKPVKHATCRWLRTYPYSTFHRWVKAGA